MTLREWETLKPVSGSPLRGFFLPEDPRIQRAACDMAERGMLRLSEMRHGLAITATSSVGRIRLGPLTITIQPKIEGAPLMHLLSYAYALHDLTLAGAGLATFELKPGSPFQDLLLYQLAVEIRTLVSSGLRREYIRADQRTAALRGKINLEKIARESPGRAFALNGTLPCTVYDRTSDTALNQVLRAGLALGRQLCDTPLLQATLRRLDNRLAENGISSPLTYRCRGLRSLLLDARRERSRLTAAYEPSLILIELLSEGAGPLLDSDIGDAENQPSGPLPGFLFDMNRLFQALLFRFLSENLPPEFSVASEQQLRNVFAYEPEWNPRSRRPPAPRPDFAILSGGKTVVLLDAKYRDLWENPLPREMLYQLAIYALSQPEYPGSRREAVILYPTLAQNASEARILVRNPAQRSGPPVTVVLRPVPLALLARLISDHNMSGAAGRLALAKTLAFGSS